jgi:hypothetical protein
MIFYFYYIDKCFILNTYKTCKLSLQHVSVHYVPSSGRVISKILKQATNGFCIIIRIVCVAAAYKIK